MSEQKIASEVTDEDWMALTSERVATALFKVSNGNKTKSQNPSFSPTGIWAKVAAVVFSNKRSNKADRLYLYSIWNDKRKNVQDEFQKLAGKGSRARGPKHPDVVDNSRCYCERDKKRTHGEKRVHCEKCQRDVHYACAKIDLNSNPKNFICGFCKGCIRIPPMLEETLHDEHIERFNNQEENVCDPTTGPHFDQLDDIFADDESLPEDSDSDEDIVSGSENGRRENRIDKPHSLDKPVNGGKPVGKPIPLPRQKVGPVIECEIGKVSTHNKSAYHEQKIEAETAYSCGLEEISSDENVFSPIPPDSETVGRKQSHSSSEDERAFFCGKIFHVSTPLESPRVSQIPLPAQSSSEDWEDYDYELNDKIEGAKHVHFEKDISNERLHTARAPPPSLKVPPMPVPEQNRPEVDDQETRKHKRLPTLGDKPRYYLDSSEEEDMDLNEKPSTRKGRSKKGAKKADVDKGERLDTSDVPKSVTMIITYDEWRNIVGMKPNTTGRNKKDFFLKNTYRQEIRKHFIKVVKFCVPGFSHNRFNNPDSTSGSFLWIRSYCLNETCTATWIFTVDKKPKESQAVKLHAKVSGDIIHYKDCPTNLIKIGPQQDQIKKRLQSSLPKSEYLHLFNEADPEALQAGNYSQLVNMKALQRMREKILGKDDHDKDSAKDLAMSNNDLETMFPDPDLPGYNQSNRTRIILYTARQMRILHTMNQVGHDAYIQLDATGCLISNLGPPYDSRAPLLYTVILRSTGSDIHMPIAEMITTKNTFLSVFQWLHEFFFTYQKMFKVKQPHYGIKKLECDFSKPFMAATVYLFTGLRMEDYITNFWLLMCGKTDVPKMFPIHICRFHILRAIGEKLKTEFCKKGKSFYRECEILKNWSQCLVFSSTMTSFQRRLMDIGVICGYEYATDAVYKRISELHEPNPNQGVEMWKKILPDNEQSLFWKRSPFGLLSELIFNKCRSKNEKICAEQPGKHILNSFYSPAFLTYIKVQIAPYYPILSHAVFDLCDLPIKDDTTNAIEQYHGLLKCNFYKKCRNQKLPRFVRRQAEFISGYCKIAETKLGIKDKLNKNQSKDCNQEKNDDGTASPTAEVNKPRWEDDEPDWDNEGNLSPNYDTTEKNNLEDLSPERAEEKFRKPQRRAPAVSVVQAFVGVIPHVKSGGKCSFGDNVVSLKNTCPIDATLQVLVGMYIHHHPFKKFLLDNRENNPLIDSVRRVMFHASQQELNEAKKVWIDEILKMPDLSFGDMRGTELDKGFGKLLSLVKVTRNFACGNQFCPTYANIEDGFDPENPNIFQTRDDAFCVASSDPEKVLKKVNEVTKHSYHCKVCNIRFLQKHIITSNPSFIVYPLTYQFNSIYDEKNLPLTQSIGGVSYKVFAYTSVRGELGPHAMDPEFSGILPHFVAVFIHDSKRLVFDGLVQKPYVQTKDSEVGGVTSVWLVRE